MRERVRFLLIVFIFLVLGAVVYWWVQGGAPEPAEPIPDTPPVARTVPAEANALPATTVAQPMIETAASLLDVTEADPAEAETPAPPTGPGVLTVQFDTTYQAVPASMMVDLHRISWKRYNAPGDDAHTWSQTVGRDEELVFRNLPLGEYWLVPAADGVTGYGGATLTRAEPEKMVRVRLLPGGEFSGRVTDEAGEPVPDAFVYAKSWRQITATGEVEDGSAKASRAPVDDEGRYVLKGRNLATMPIELRLVASAPGYAPQVGELVHIGEKDIDFVLTPGGSASGVVTNRDTGDPVAGIQVVLTSSGVFDRQSVITDEQGRFALAKLSPGEHTVDVIHDSFVVADESARFQVAEGMETRDVGIQVALGGSIAGRVYDEETGAGIAGATIYASSQSPGLVELTDTTDTNGYYRVRGLKTAAYRVDLSPPDGYPSNAPRERRDTEITVGIGTEVTGIDFSLSRGLQIAGLVVDTNGEPVAGARVSAASEAIHFHQSAVSKSDGSFAVSGVQPDQTYVVRALATELAQVDEIEPISVWNDSVRDVRIVLGPPGAIEGIVVDQAGRPRDRIFINAQRALGGRGYGGRSTSNAEGEFKITGLAAGEYEFSFSRNAGNFARVEGNPAVTVVSGETVSGVRLIVPDEGEYSIAGLVVDRSGKPVSGVRVSAFGAEMRSESSGENGRFELARVKAGSYQVFTQHSDYSSWSANGVEAGTPEARNLRIRLEGLGLVEGRVLDARTRRPIETFTITRASAGPRPYNQTTEQSKTFSDPQGRFRLDDVEAGDANLTIKTIAYATTQEVVSGVSEDRPIVGLTFYLEPEARLEGVVVDPFGNPVAGATVSVQVARPEVVQTRRDGRFAFSALPGGSVTVSAQHDVYAPAWKEVTMASSSVTQTEIMLKEGGILDGTVTLNGRPLENVRISAGSQQASQFAQNVVTDADGSFQLRGVSPGLVTVQAIAMVGARGNNKLVEAEVESGAVTTVHIVFSEGTGRIRGTVYLDEDSVSNGGHVSARVETNDGIEVIGVEIDADGSYVVENLPEGLVRLHVYTQGGERQQTTVEIGEGETLEQDIHLNEAL